MASLDLQHIVKEFGRHRIIKNLSLSINDGEFVVVVGPSGCGKSTLLRLIAGLEKPDRGHIFFDGARAEHLSPYERNVGMVFQNYALYPHLSVFENLAFGLKAHRSSSADTKRRVTNVSELLELDPLLNKKPKELSGGQKQRVALGRALVRQPHLFLMDEPLSNLDANLRDKMRTELRSLHEKVGITTIYVTHDQVEAMTMADRIVVLKDGAIEQIGTPENIYTHPATTFVARFMGSPAMNLIKVVPQRRGDHWHVTPLNQSEQSGIFFPGLPLMGSELPSVLWLGMRPEAIRLEPPDTDDDVITLSIHVDHVELLGAHYHIHAHWMEEPLSIIADHFSRTVRDQLTVYVQANALHAFHGDTGESLMKYAESEAIGEQTNDEEVYAASMA